jgi:hypothetical protein
MLSIVGWKVACVRARVGRGGTFAAAAKMTEVFLERTQERTWEELSFGPPHPMDWDTLYHNDREYSLVFGKKPSDVPDMGMRPETMGSFFQAKDQ